MPRLSKGQRATSIQARMDFARASTIARLDALRSEGARIDSALLERFLNLDSLASWDEPDRGIHPLSPKTLRRHIDGVFDGGYQAFRVAVEAMKRRVRETTETELHSRKVREHISSTVKAETERATDATLEMTARYLDLLQRLQRLGTSNPIAARLLEGHFKVFGTAPAHVRRVK